MGSDEPVPVVFPEHSVGRALDWRLNAVAVVKEDHHRRFSSRFLIVSYGKSAIKARWMSLFPDAETYC